MTYSLWPTIFSALVAMGFSGAAFLYVGGKPFSLPRCLVAGVAVGLAVAAMHYIGMSAMRMPAIFRWNSSLIVLSVLIAILAATVAIWLAFNVQREGQRVAAAVVMAVAIGGMHYTGAAAGVVVCSSPLGPGQAGQVGGAALPYVAFIGAVTILIAMRWQMHRSYRRYQLRMAARVDDLLGAAHPARPVV
ncbi:bacterial signaling repeat protein [Bordetella holmesii 30539]|uniref:Signaling domain protein n=2 Tax=Bordetella holmesii TaxID=35814 RepID=A0A158LYS0_9BORD|nr:bacterial signaling repeat protein [Bordetella holmesii 44057]EWM41893.1 bacterial signaling repeat family protein [Bordetella holmesii 41130]EWM46071.1 bacterial signaling repeat protein [Bordetella holmesii 35009]EWM50221.1 bacterial signaling repeat family protein [Bordetella holmesii 70147]EXF89133.1 bacterial signaling repeat protein [Bordetella holmesii 30539]EXX95339.1 bacterial signaling repeat protein [Bordetella holmesii 1058]KAK84138.1 signaling domain protein [Bordetella holmes